MKDLTSTTFGYLIGFLLPGVFGLFALSAWFPEAGVILQPVMKADASIGPSVAFLLIAVGMGMCLNAIRWLVFEKWICKAHQLPPNMFTLLTKENALTAFKSVVDEHYRYHQFYGCCAVAAFVLFVGWLHKNFVQDWRILWVIVGFVAVELVLGYAGADTFEKYVKRASIVLNSPTEGVAPPAIAPAPIAPAPTAPAPTAPAPTEVIAPATTKVVAPKPEESKI